MGKLTVGALRAVLVVVLAGTVFVQASMVWALATDPEDGSLPLTPLRVITILGMVSVQVALVCVWRLVTMVRRGTVLPRRLPVRGRRSARSWRLPRVVRGHDLNAPGQRADRGHRHHGRGWRGHSGVASRARAADAACQSSRARRSSAGAGRVDEVI